MMIDTKKIKDALQRDLDALAKARDELKVQAQLAKAEARSELDRLENTWQRVQEEIRRVGNHSKEPVKEIGTAARTLLDELKHGYDRVKQELKSPRT